MARKVTNTRGTGRDKAAAIKAREEWVKKVETEQARRNSSKRARISKAANLAHSSKTRPKPPKEFNFTRQDYIDMIKAVSR